MPVLFEVANCDLKIASLRLPMHLGRDFQAQTIQPDEAGGVHVRVVVHAFFRALATGFSSGST